MLVKSCLPARNKMQKTDSIPDNQGIHKVSDNQRLQTLFISKEKKNGLTSFSLSRCRISSSPIFILSNWTRNDQKYYLIRATLFLAL